MRGSSAIWLRPSQHTRVPAFDMAWAVPAERAGSALPGSV